MYLSWYYNFKSWILLSIIVCNFCLIYLLSIVNSDHRHFIIYKPFGYLSQFIVNTKRRSNKSLLGELFSFPEGTMAIGRLDEASEGLLLLTTNGAASMLIRGRKVEKEYVVQVDGEITEEAIRKLEEGLVIGTGEKQYTTRPAKVCKLDEIPDFPDRGRKIRDDRHGATSWVSITISEGKNRQVRRMTAVVGFPTLRLIRIRIGNIQLENRVSGAVEEVAFFDLGIDKY